MSGIFIPLGLGITFITAQAATMLSAVSVAEADRSHVVATEELLRQKSDSIQAEFNRIFQYELPSNIPIRVLEEARFFRELALPEHSVAVYADGAITIGIPGEKRVNLRALERTLRHEFVHVYVDILSGGNCPAWFDEGLAQLLEGRLDDSREVQLQSWLASGQPPIELGALVDNLHLLDPELVPIAYGEALFAVRSLVNRKGFSAVRAYLHALRSGRAPEEAFLDAFGEELPEFEARLHEQLRKLYEFRMD